jgi:ribosome-associated heat shock protein Hsp15
VNGRPAKPATTVVVGDQVTVTLHGDERVLEAVRIIDKRVGAAVAATCFIDHSPPVAPRERVVAPFTRERASGRPTKRERRQLDRFRQR